jgi:ureidoglycolate hydrolase
MPGLRRLVPALAEPVAFAPFGQVILPAEDGLPFGPDDAQLDLAAGTPRFYAMRLHRRPGRFDRITRHHRVTQCLGSMMGVPWRLAVAPPSRASDAPDPDAIRAFAVPGDRFVKLHAGTWHAGPYFDAPHADFYNLELADTNVVDHDTCRLAERFGLAFEFDVS